MFNEARNELFSLRDLLRFTLSRFNEARLYFGHGSQTALDEAVYLLLHCLHLPPDTDITPYLDARLIHSERAHALNLIEQRVTQRIPAAYLTHEAWLGDYRFYVDEHVIVPRSYIASLLEEQLSPWLADPWTIHRVLDLCTGSGCLAIMAADAFPEAHVDAVDISPEALTVAKHNINDYALSERITLWQSDGFSALRGQCYDLIISNPPYVNAQSMAELPAEYRHEPAIALASGEDGLDFVRHIFANAAQHLMPEGLLVVEIGHNQEVLEASFPNTSFIWLDTPSKDNAVFLLRRNDIPHL